MRRMYDEFYVKSPNNSYYLHGRGYTTQDLARVSSEVAGFDLMPFFDQYARDVQTLPYDEALGYVGLYLVREQSREPFNAGINLDWEMPEGVMIGTVRPDSPAENAGLQRGDEIISLGGKKVSRDNWIKALARYKSGERVPLVVKRDRDTIRPTIILGEPDRFEYRIEEKKDATADQKAARAAWLRS
jgi:predicted metalloprotease with PDZ domain